MTRGSKHVPHPGVVEIEQGQAAQAFDPFETRQQVVTAQIQGLEPRQRLQGYKRRDPRRGNREVFQMLELLRLEEESERFRLDREAAAAWKISQVMS